MPTAGSVYRKAVPRVYSRVYRKGYPRRVPNSLLAKQCPAHQRSEVPSSLSASSVQLPSQLTVFEFMRPAVLSSMRPAVPAIHTRPAVSGIHPASSIRHVLGQQCPGCIWPAVSRHIPPSSAWQVPAHQYPLVPGHRCPGVHTASSTGSSTASSTGSSTASSVWFSNGRRYREVKHGEVSGRSRTGGVREVKHERCPGGQAREVSGRLRREKERDLCAGSPS